MLFEFMTHFNGFNNGFIGMSHRQAAAIINVSRATGDRCLQELIDRGFLVRTWKGRRIDETKKIASSWEITCYPKKDIDGKDVKPSKEYLNWKGAPVKVEGKKSLEDIHQPAERKSRKKMGLKALGEATPIDMNEDAKMYELPEPVMHDSEDIPF